MRNMPPCLSQKQKLGWYIEIKNNQTNEIEVFLILFRYNTDTLQLGNDLILMTQL